MPQRPPINSRIVSQFAARLRRLMDFDVSFRGSVVKRRPVKYTSKVVAKAIGVGHNTVNRWENAKIAPRLDELHALLQFFNVSGRWLFGLPKESEKQGGADTQKQSSASARANGGA